MPRFYQKVTKSGLPDNLLVCEQSFCPLILLTQWIVHEGLLQGDLGMPKVDTGVPVVAHRDQQGPETIATGPREVIPNWQGRQNIVEKQAEMKWERCN